MSAAQRVVGSPELLGMVCEYLCTKDLGSLRGICQSAEQIIWPSFSRKLQETAFAFTVPGIKRLLNLTQVERVARLLQEIVIRHVHQDFGDINKRSDLIADEYAELSRR